ncbi:hypothetical protein QEN19_001975 [Hanseniaspora menglaensis]
MVVNVNNWHWTDKNCLPWAKKYFERVLKEKIFKSVNDIEFKITNISQLEGDCEVNQRKGKLMSLFDMQMVLDFDVLCKENKYQGTIKIPEIAFDSEVEDYQYDITILKEKSDDSFLIREFFKQDIKEELSLIFYKFNDDLLAENAKDIQLDAEKVTSTYTSQNAQKTKAAKVFSENLNKKEIKKADSAAISAQATGFKQNTTTLKFQETFTTKANQLYQTYLSPQFIQAWSRGTFHPLTSLSSSLLSNGEKYGLFNDNIITTIISLKEGEKQSEIIMSWRLNDWVKDQESQLHLKFHESSEFGETTMEVIWSGVPLGQEDRVKERFREIYVRGVKIIFGFGMVL